MGRLCNLVYATLVDEPGAMADRAEVREHLDTALKRASATKTRTPMRRAALSIAQAKRMASDLDDHDSKIVAGRMTGA